jgi:hypothetical protein
VELDRFGIFYKWFRPLEFLQNKGPLYWFWLLKICVELDRFGYVDLINEDGFFINGTG